MLGSLLFYIFFRQTIIVFEPQFGHITLSEIDHKIILRQCSPSTDSSRTVVSYWRKHTVHLVLVNRLGGLCLPRNSVDRLTDWLGMTLMVLTGP